jgi:hypothetical protein
LKGEVAGRFLTLERPAQERTTGESFPEVVVPVKRVEQRREALVRDKIMFLLGLNLILLVVGCVMDIFSGILVVAPLVVPVAQAYGIDLVHLGIIFAMNLELGFATPPFGINLFISHSFFKKSMLTVFLATIPYLTVLLGVLAVVTYWPALSLFPVRHPPREIFAMAVKHWYISVPAVAAFLLFPVILARLKPPMAPPPLAGEEPKPKAGR